MLLKGARAQERASSHACFHHFKPILRKRKHARLAILPLRKQGLGDLGQAHRTLQVHAAPQRAPSFPAGRKQARVQLPASFLIVKTSEVGSSTEILGPALSAGATGIILEDDSGSGGAELYEAAIKLKDLIRGRAVLLISDRTDIANAVEADGVSLSSKGVPVLVGRRMLTAKDGLVARNVGSPSEASEAAAAGANLIILQVSGSSSAEAVSQAKRGQKSGASIPVIASISQASEATDVAKSGADGVLLKVNGMNASSAAKEVEETLAAFPDTVSNQTSSAPSSSEVVQTGDGKLKHFLDSSKETLLEDERSFLQEALAFLQEAAPDIEEIGLLSDAIKQLDELFLVVVVGEFNSGKSTIINALLGNRYLQDGILPTTNEIAVLKFSDDGSEEMTQTSDGLYVRKLPAELLKDINIVDTPGTNVIVDRQQRLTEEYVPRADIVLFCMSADRPFTESETKFLKYIRQWGKKIIFVVNKVDILSSDQEVQEVSKFVAESATRMLGVDGNRVLPVSARSALDVKLDLGGGRMAGAIISDDDKQALEGNPKWLASRFGPLETFILDFLIGGKSAGESVRLKLQTPLFVADALLDAGRQQLEDDLSAAEEDVATIKRVQGQIQRFRQEMKQDGEAQRRQARKTISNATKAAQNLVETTLQLSNFDGLSSYIFGSKGREGIAAQFQKQVSKPFSQDLEDLVQEHSSWLESNCGRQLSNYRTFAEQRAADLGVSGSPQQNGASPSVQDASAAEERRRWRESRSVPQATDSTALSTQVEVTAIQVLREFDPNSGAIILEEEVREAVIKTAGAAVGAAGLGVFSTFILPNTLEDFLGLAIGGVVGYAALLNLPLRRNDAKEKLQNVAGKFAEDLNANMESEMNRALDQCVSDINQLVEPLQKEAEAIVERIMASQEKLANISNDLQRLQQRAANVE